ncbi:MAG: hypothetical protein ACE5LC_03260 [Candidatus Aminicenantales bacterium]
MAQNLKVDLHLHTAEDPYEKITYTAFDLIDRAGEEGYDVIAITNHNTITYHSLLREYAREKGVLLLPGVEATFSKKHVVIINPGIKFVGEEMAFEELAEFKKEDSLIIAPHPFFPGISCLKSLLHQYIDLFDAIEFCHCYNHLVNFNKKAINSSLLYKKPLLGTSDTHNHWQFGRTYSLVEAEKNPSSVIKGIKEGKIKIVSNPLPLATFFRVGVNFIISQKLKIKYRV